MSSVKKYSIFIRTICGVLGMSSIFVTIFNFYNSGEFVVDFNFILIFFATFTFMYVAITGASPLARINCDKQL